MRGGNGHKTERAQDLRKVKNTAEELLWSDLRARRLNGYKFARQIPTGPYFADFACRGRNLGVKVDGSQHADKASDRFRDATMQRNGWSVLRIWHVDVLRDRQRVVNIILAALDGLMAEPISSPELRYLPAASEWEPVP